MRTTWLGETARFLVHAKVKVEIVWRLIAVIQHNGFLTRCLHVVSSSLQDAHAILFISGATSARGYIVFVFLTRVPRQA